VIEGSLLRQRVELQSWWSQAFPCGGRCCNEAAAADCCLGGFCWTRRKIGSLEGWCSTGL